MCAAVRRLEASHVRVEAGDAVSAPRLHFMKLGHFHVARAADRARAPGMKGTAIRGIERARGFPVEHDTESAPRRIEDRNRAHQRSRIRVQSALEE